MILIKEQSELERIVPKLLEHTTWGVDTETNGSDPHVNRVHAIQIGRNPDVPCYIIDTRRVNPEPLRGPFFENPSIFKIFHNAKFDYKMLRGSFNFITESIRCTFLNEKILSAGKIHYLSKEHKYDKVVFNRLGVKLPDDKESMQKSFLTLGDQEFSPRQLEYMRDDVIYPVQVLQHQNKELMSLGLARTSLLENEVCPVFGDMEFEGMKLDPIAWSAITSYNIEEAAKLKDQMDALVAVIQGTNMFGEVDMNYGSPAQVLKLLQKIGIRIKRYDRDARKEVEELIRSTNDNSLKQVKNNEFVTLLRKWRSYNTRVNNFGDSYINAIHPRTGCIHPNLWQIGTGTGRPASGESDVNPLNIPREQKYRSCFICDPHEIVESDDFSGCESRILAHISQDPTMLEIFRKNEDIHCGAATRLYNVTVTKKENKHLRAPAKALNFGISYGMGPNKLHDDLNAQGFAITREKARELYYKYVEEFKTAVMFLRDNGKLAAQQGWLANLNGRRRWWALPDKASMDASSYQGILASIEREGGNFLIQSVNADITKEAMINIRTYRRKHGIRTKFINAIYDEIVTRTDQSQSEAFHIEKLRIMREAGEKWITSVPMTVDGSVGPHWRKE